MNYIIIDKSWIDGASIQKITDLTKYGILVISAVLAYELLTSSNENRQIEIFKKLNSVKDKIRLMEHPGQLLLFEKNENKPAKQINHFFLPANFEFDSNLLKQRNTFSKEQIEIIEKFKNRWEIEGTKLFIESGLSGLHYFPELREIGSGKKREAYMCAYDKILTNDKFIKKVYTDIQTNNKSENFPSVNILNSHWVIYKWIQVQLLYNIDFVRKYGHYNKIPESERYQHDNIDMDYLILGLVSGSIATNDKDIKYFFKNLLPNGNLYT